MKTAVLFLASAALVGAAVCDVKAASSDYSATKDAAAADNSAQNARDSGGRSVTPMDQSNKPEDLDLTKRIRKAVETDNNLSMEAKNIKIVTVDGVVWLRGPVKSAGEKQEIARAADKIAGTRNVHDELEIARGGGND